MNIEVERIRKATKNGCGVSFFYRWEQKIVGCFMIIPWLVSKASSVRSSACACVGSTRGRHFYRKIFFNEALPCSRERGSRFVTRNVSAITVCSIIIRAYFKISIAGNTRSRTRDQIGEWSMLASFCSFFRRVVAYHFCLLWS